MYVLYLVMGMYAGLTMRYLKWKHIEKQGHIHYLPYLYDSSDAQFQFLSPLQQNWHAIRDEAVLAMRSAPILDVARARDEWVQSGDIIEKNLKSYGWVSAWQVDSEDDGNPDWLNYGIMFNGSFFEKNIEHCPVLTACLEPISSRINICGFSLMRPCTKINRHTDSTGIQYGSLAYHLGLCVPDGVHETCKLVVGNFAIPEEDGKTIIFDSSYSHYAENNACADRVILYIDFKL